MIKYRMIRAFVCVWLAVCLSYAGARMALGAMLDGLGALNEPEEAESAAQSIVVTDADETATQVGLGGAVGSVSEESPVDQTEFGTSEAFEDTEADDLADDNEVWTEDDAAAQQTEVSDIPTLSEYLSWYTCGSCRHNCSLSNPRCHNGSRLAELKAQEYYELYGQ